MKHLAILILFININSFLNSQNAIDSNYSYTEARADNLADKGLYGMAIKYYIFSLTKDNNNNRLIYKVGKSHKILQNYSKALKFYKSIEKEFADSAKFIFELSQIYIALKDYDNGYNYYNKYLTICPNCYKKGMSPSDSISFFSIKERFANNKEIGVKLPEATLNYAPQYFSNGFVFLSTKKNQTANKHVTLNSHSSLFSDLYYYDANSKKTSLLLSKKLSQKFNEGPIAFVDNNNKIYLTRSNQSDDKIIKDKNDKETVRLNIKLIEKDAKNEFSIIKDVFIGSDIDINYDFGHPTITNDGNYIIFMSNREGGYGGTDLWKSKILNDTTFSTPINLGPKINTIGNELFPYIAIDGSLIYSSNGLLGLGNLDMYISFLADDGYSFPINLGAPLNSEFDDFGLIYDPKYELAYFTSNRHKKYKTSDNIKMLNDNIYTFNFENFVTKVYIIDSITKKPISDALVLDTFRETTYYSDSTGLAMVTSKGLLKKLLNVRSRGYQEKNLFINPYQDYVTIEIVPLNEYNILSNNNSENIGNSNIKSEKSKVKFVDRDSKEKFNNAYLTKINIALGTTTRLLMDDSSMTNLISNENIFDCIFISETSKDTFFVSNQLTRNNNNKIIYLYKFANNKGVFNVFYDTDKFNIKNEYIIDLDRAIKILKSNNNLKVKLISHCDCRQTNQYNKILSTNRTNEVQNYLKSNGISLNRISTSSVGETMPINACSCINDKNEQCTDEELQENRRTEVIIH